MRVGRVAAGLALVGAGWLAIAVGVTGCVVGAHRSDGAFVAELAPVHTDGVAVVLPDVAELVERHGVGALLGEGQLAIAVRSDHPIDVEVLAARELPRLLGTVSHTDVVGVGFALGLQPVQTVERPGAATSGSGGDSVVAVPGSGDSSPIVPASSLVEAGRSVLLDIPAQEPTAIVVRRTDGLPGLTVGFTVGLAPSAWEALIAFSLTAGVLCLATGALVLLLRPATDPVVVDFATPDADPSPQWTGRRPAPVAHSHGRYASLRRRGEQWRKDRKPTPTPTPAPRTGATESPYVHTAT